MEKLRFDIEAAAKASDVFRRVLWTGQNSQLVLMSLKAGEEIGEEVHHLDQLLFFVAGSGKAVLDDKEMEFSAGQSVVVPAGTKHNFINTAGSEAVKLYTVYAPAEHPDGTVHQTKAEADAAEAAEHQH